MGRGNNILAAALAGLLGGFLCQFCISRATAENRSCYNIAACRMANALERIANNMEKRK